MAARRRIVETQQAVALGLVKRAVLPRQFDVVEPPHGNRRPELVRHDHSAPSRPVGQRVGPSRRREAGAYQALQPCGLMQPSEGLCPAIAAQFDAHTWKYIGGDIDVHVVQLRGARLT